MLGSPPHSSASKLASARAMNNATCTCKSESSSRGRPGQFRLLSRHAAAAANMLCWQQSPGQKGYLACIASHRSWLPATPAPCGPLLTTKMAAPGLCLFSSAVALFVQPRGFGSTCTCNHGGRVAKAALAWDHWLLKALPGLQSAQLAPLQEHCQIATQKGCLPTLYGGFCLKCLISMLAHIGTPLARKGKLHPP